MAEARLKRWNRAADGEPREATVKSRLEALGYRVSRYTYAPGTHFPPHVHAVDKCDAVVSGLFEIRCGGQAFELRAGDLVFVPAGVEHEARVIGAAAVVSLDGTKGEG